MTSVIDKLLQAMQDAALPSLVWLVVIIFIAGLLVSLVPRRYKDHILLVAGVVSLGGFLVQTVVRFFQLL